MRLIILNGPRDTGKDTAADYLVERYGYTKLEMKGALRRLAHEIASLTCADPVAFCNALEFDRDLKDTKRVPEFGNRTWPEFIIWLSETVCKPIFGQDVFALAAVKAVRDSGADRIVFSDSGFQEEVNALYNALHTGEMGEMTHIDDMLLVHMYREGRSFDSVRKDSRSYVAHPDLHGDPYPLHNDAGIVQLKCELDLVMRRFDVDNHVSNKVV